MGKDKRRLRGFIASVRRIGLALLAIALLFYWWVPMDYDLRQRRPSGTHPSFEVDETKLFTKEAKALVVTAHPDDEAYYIGGTLAELGKAGVEITLVVCTYGDKAYYGPFTNVEENRRIRKSELETSAKAFGAREVRFLGFTDGRLRDDERVRSTIQKEIERVVPDYLLTFDDAYPPMISHRDHRRCGEATVAAAKRSGFKGTLLLFATGGENYWNNISEAWDGKARLLAIHKSQFSGEKLQRVEATLMDNAVTAAEHTNGTYAEGFRVSRASFAK